MDDTEANPEAATATDSRAETDEKSEADPNRESSNNVGKDSTVGAGGDAENQTKWALLWSLGSGLPFLLAGISVLAVDTTAPAPLGYLSASLGTFVWIGGFVTHFSAPPNPKVYDDETIGSTTTPTLRITAAKNIIGVVLAAIGAILLIDTTIPLAYPLITLLAGVYLYSSGIFEFWVNSLTRYFLTNRRFVKRYQLLSVRSKSIPITRIQATEENRTMFERLFGIGHVAVESAGDSSTSRIVARAIEHPRVLAERLQSQIQNEREEGP
jgi:membrane protein YdbS with pleckstrin-like domain